MRLRRFVHMILLLGVGGLAWQVFLAWSHTHPLIVADPSPGLTKDLPSLPQAGPATGKKLVGVITDKNLFAPDRRPAKKIPERNPDAQKPVVPPPDHLKLVGIFMAGDRLEALFADSSKGGKVKRVSYGDSFDAYHLTRLTHSEATLALGPGGDEVSLSLDIQKSSEAVKAPRTAPPRRRIASKAQDADGKSETASPLVLGSDAVQTAATPAAKKADAKDEGKDDASSIRQNIRQLQRRLREIRRRRARERREARAEEREARPERQPERQTDRRSREQDR